MNTELLKTFIEVSRTRHFGKAAGNLYLTQSAVSFRVKQLEAILGADLFSRERNNILLTPAGERLLPHAEHILASWQLALQDVGIPDSQEQLLALGGSSNLWDTFLQSLLPRLAKAIPGLCLRTEINTSQELIRSVLGSRLEIMVTLDPPGIRELTADKIGQIELVLVSSLVDVAADELASVGHIHVDWGTAFNLQQARLFETPIAPILHTGQCHIALEFLLTHGGTAFLPRAMVSPHLEAGDLHLVSQIDSVSREVFAVYHTEALRRDLINSVIALLQEMDLKPHDPGDL